MSEGGGGDPGSGRKIHALRDQLGHMFGDSAGPSGASGSGVWQDRQRNLLSLWNDYRDAVRSHYLPADEAHGSGSRDAFLAKLDSPQSNRGGPQGGDSWARLSNGQGGSFSPARSGMNPRVLEARHTIGSPARSPRSPGRAASPPRMSSPRLASPQPTFYSSGSNLVGPSGVKHQSYREQLQHTSMDKLFPLENTIKIQDLLIDVSDPDFDALPAAYIQELVKLASVIMHRVKSSSQYANQN